MFRANDPRPAPQRIRGLLAWGGLATLIPIQAFALPYHVPIYAEPAPGLTSCRYPDGTVPRKQPEIHCYDPTRFLKAYGIDQLHQQGLTGKGQTIILADSFGSPTLQQDLDHFSDTFGLPRATIRFIYPNGPYVNPLTSDEQLSWAEETTLDLQWAHAVAPEATLVNIVTNTGETTGVAGLPELFAGVQTAIHDYPGAIISMSFGTGEPTFTGDDVRTYLNGSFHEILKQAVAADMTVLASSGDSGSTNINAQSTSLMGYPNASYPATDPLITAVGGTALEADWIWTPQGTADDYWSCKLQGSAACPKDFFLSSPALGNRLETVWKEDFALAAGGGGVSTIFDAPPFQSGLAGQIREITKGHRGLPDFSMNAAINGGVEIYTSFLSPSQQVTAPQWLSTGGTSCSSPEAAGLVALAGEQASLELGIPVGIGFLNPILYSLGNHDFNDIVPQVLGTNLQVTIDNNALYFSAALLAAAGPTKVPPVNVPGYFTGPGYNLATGRGSPRAVTFVLDVARARALRPGGISNLIP